MWQSVSVDLAMPLADGSANKHSRSMQLYVNIVHFLKLMRVVLKNVPLERWNQLMIGDFKTVNLAWVNKVAMIGYPWLFVYEIACRYEERMLNAAPGERIHPCRTPLYISCHSIGLSLTLTAAI